MFQLTSSSKRLAVYLNGDSGIIIKDSMFQTSKLFFLLATLVVALKHNGSATECNMQKCKVLYNELTTCAGAVMDNYGNRVIEPPQ